VPCTSSCPFRDFFDEKNGTLSLDVIICKKKFGEKLVCGICWEILCRTQVVNHVLLKLLVSFSHEKHQNFVVQFWCIWRRPNEKVWENCEKRINQPGTPTFAAVTCCTLSMPILQQNDLATAAKRDSSINSARQLP